MNAGIVLDRLIAKQLFPGRLYQGRPPHFSTEIAEVWQVVELALKNRGIYSFALLRNFSGKGWQAGLYNEQDSDWDIVAEGETAPHAICLAALKAMSTA